MEVTMSEDTPRVPYGDMFGSSNSEPVEEAPVVSDPEPELVDETPVVSDPEPEPVEEAPVVSDPEPEIVDDSPATHVQNNLDDMSLRLRKEADIRSEVLGDVAPKETLRVLDDSDVEWMFVETVDGERGYVRKKFLVDVTNE
jgi:hypothetical protein